VSRFVVALWTAAAADPDSERHETEFLRLAVAALAAGAAVTLFDLRPAGSRAAHAGTENERHLAALTDAGARLESSPVALRTALVGADSVLRLAPRLRAGAPALLRLTTSWLRTVSEHELVSTLSAAGQVVRV
jgi:hypothetical protein